MFDSRKYSAGVEVDKCRDRLAKFCIGNGLDVGCGGTNSDTRFYWENKIVPSAIGVDLARTNLTGRADDLFWFHNECLDYVFSSHLLEHLKDYKAALKEWMRVLKVGGYLVMYLPLQGCYPDVGMPGANADHKHNLTPGLILNALKTLDVHFEIVHIEERKGGEEYSFDCVLRKAGVVTLPAKVMKITNNKQLHKKRRK